MGVNKYMSEKTPENSSAEEVQKKAEGQIMDLVVFLNELEEKEITDLGEVTGSDLLFTPEEKWVDGEWKTDYRKGKEKYLDILKRKINDLDNTKPFLNDELKREAQIWIDKAENIVLAYQKNHKK